MRLTFTRKPNNYTRGTRSGPGQNMNRRAPFGGVPEVCGMYRRKSVRRRKHANQKGCMFHNSMPDIEGKQSATSPEVRARAESWTGPIQTVERRSRVVQGGGGINGATKRNDCLRIIKRTFIRTELLGPWEIPNTRDQRRIANPLTLFNEHTSPRAQPSPCVGPDAQEIDNL